MEVVTLKEYSTRCGLPYKTITKMVRDGTLSAGKYGKRWMLIVEEADRQLKALFAPEPKVKVPKVKRGSYKDALKALAY